MTKAHLKLVTPSIVIRTVMPQRPPNADLRTREYLTEAEVERLMTAAKRNRWGHRDATMILVAYRHGLRASELTDLRWDQVDFATAFERGSPFTTAGFARMARAWTSVQAEEATPSFPHAQAIRPRQSLTTPRQSVD